MNQPKDHVDGGFSFLWNPVFAKATNENLRRAQEFVDSECIRQMKRYTPYRTGFLSNNAPKLGTKIGSGLIVYNARPGASLNTRPQSTPTRRSSGSRR